jgi:hypothetical protein
MSIMPERHLLNLEKYKEELWTGGVKDMLKFYGLAPTQGGYFIQKFHWVIVKRFSLVITQRANKLPFLRTRKIDIR